MAAAAGGLDALVFTGGVGEHAAADPLRRGRSGSRSSASRSTPAANERASGDTELTRAGATVRAAVVTAREDLEMARQARAALA